MLLTTGNSFEGYEIVEYLDIISEEVVFKNSFINALGGAVSNLVDSFRLSETEMTGATEWIRAGKEYTREKFIKRATTMGANAVLGIDFESSFGADIVKTTMSGTAVVVRKIHGETTDETEKGEKWILIKKSNCADNETLRLFEASFFDMDHVVLSVISNQKITAIKGQIIIKTVLDEQVISTFEVYSLKPGIHNIYITPPIRIKSEAVSVSAFSEIWVKIEKYVSNDVLKVVDEKSMVELEPYIPEDEHTKTIQSLEMFESASAILEALEKEETFTQGPWKAVFGEFKQFSRDEATKGENLKEQLILALKEYDANYNGVIKGTIHPVENNGKIVCPFCKREQMAGRNNCFKCGISFVGIQ